MSSQGDDDLDAPQHSAQSIAQVSGIPIANSPKQMNQQATTEPSSNPVLSSELCMQPERSSQTNNANIRHEQNIQNSNQSTDSARQHLNYLDQVISSPANTIGQHSSESISNGHMDEKCSGDNIAIAKNRPSYKAHKVQATVNSPSQ